MKAFIVSIPRNSQRLDFLTKRLTKLKLDFEVCMGIDGDDMSDETFRTFDQTRYAELYGRTMNKHEISCALGHINVWRMLVSQDVEEALILEDDVCVLGCVPRIIQHIKDRKISYEVLYLHHGKAKKWPIYSALPDGYRLYRYLRPTKNSRRAVTYATAYLLTKRAASVLLKISEANIMPADFTLGLLQHHRLLTFGVEPCCIDHDHFETTIPNRF